MKRLLAALMLAPSLVFAQPLFEHVIYLNCSSARLLGEMFVEMSEENASARVAFTYGSSNTDEWSIFKLPLYIGTGSTWLYSSPVASLSVHETSFKGLYETTWKAAGRTHPLSCELIEQQ